MPHDRRAFVRNGAMGLLAFQVAGAVSLLRPREARAQALPLRVLTPDDRAVVEALGETLLPGATESGIAHYLDQQLAADAADSLLMIRYLDVPPPYAGFYKPAIAAVDTCARRQFGKRFADLSSDERTAFVTLMQKSNPEGWQAPPAPFFYFVFRSDVVDVVYGTEEGFEKLGIPYMAHIPPPKKW